MNYDATNVVPLHPTASATLEVCRLAPIEVKWVRQADHECLKASAALRHAGPTLLGQISASEHALEEQLQRYSAVHSEHRALGLKDFHPLVSDGRYRLLLVVATLLEAPVNKAAMSFLAMHDWETWAVAGLVSAFNVLGASFVGKKLRQVASRPCRDWFVLGSVSTTVACAMTAFAGLRADHVALAAIADGLPTSDWTMMSLLAMQALFFVIGAAISFAMVPAQAQLERVLKDKSKLRVRIDALLRQRTTLAAQHDRLWLKTEQAIGERQTHCQALAGEYRDENFSARGTQHPVPAWMRHPLDPGVFAPVDLGTRLIGSMPSTEQLLSRVETREDALTGGTDLYSANSQSMAPQIGQLTER